MEPYHIKHQQQETANHSEHSFAHYYSTHDTNTQHLHDEISVLPTDTHLKFHATEFKQLTQTHSLHDLNAH